MVKQKCDSQQNWDLKLTETAATAESVLAESWAQFSVEEMRVKKSPAESLLSMVLNTLFYGELLTDRLELRSNEPVETKQKAGRPFVVDFLLSQKQTGAKMIIEVDGHTYHRRNAEEFTREISRERALQRSGLFFMRFSAAEVLDDPWERGLDVLDTVNEGAALGFEPIMVPKGLFQSIREVTKAEETPGETETVEEVGQASMRAREVIYVQSVKAFGVVKDEANLHESLINIRRKHARAYEPWSSDEEQVLVDAVKSGFDRLKIATILKRQKTAIDARLDKLGVETAG